MTPDDPHIEPQPHVPQLFVDVATCGGISEARIRYGALVIGYVCEPGGDCDFITPLGAKMAAEETIAFALFGAQANGEPPPPALRAFSWFRDPPRGWDVPIGTRPGEQRSTGL